jgi:hypothetical protein
VCDAVYDTALKLSLSARVASLLDRLDDRKIKFEGVKGVGEKWMLLTLTPVPTSQECLVPGVNEIKLDDHEKNTFLEAVDSASALNTQAGQANGHRPGVRGPA